jgi:hypothetical protein
MAEYERVAADRTFGSMTREQLIETIKDLLQTIRIERENHFRELENLTRKDPKDKSVARRVE